MASHTDYVQCEECDNIDYQAFMVHGLCNLCVAERVNEWPDTLAAIVREEHARQ